MRKPREIVTSVQQVYDRLSNENVAEKHSCQKFCQHELFRPFRLRWKIAEQSFKLSMVCNFHINDLVEHALFKNISNRPAFLW